MHTSRVGLGYDVVVSSMSSSGLAESRKVVFVVGGVETELLEEPLLVVINILMYWLFQNLKLLL